jgi:hypothetical protein
MPKVEPPAGGTDEALEATDETLEATDETLEATDETLELEGRTPFVPMFTITFPPNVIAI